MQGSGLTLRLLLILTLGILVACGGGGGGMAPATSVMTVSSGSSAGSGSSGAGQWDYGNTTPQFALPGGPTFNGPNYSANTGVSFPAISKTLQAGSTVVSPQDAAILIVDSKASSSMIRVVIPSIGMDETFSANTSLQGFQGDTPYWGLNYVVLGEWAHWNAGRTTALTDTLFGYETPVSAMPTSGTAQFAGFASGAVFKGSDNGLGLSGLAAFSVNFSSGQLTGALTKMTAGGLPWNDVSLSGNIMGGTNKFSGTTAVTSTPSFSPPSLSGSATGTFNGAFYGPGAENIGAVWSLTDGTGSAVGGALGRR